MADIEKTYITGVNGFLNDLKEISKGNKLYLSSLLAEAAIETHKIAKENIQQGPPRTGTWYIRGKKRNKIHKASAAGEWPKTDTGKLTRSITFRRHGNLNYTVGSRKGAPHGYFLEMGTSKMAPRPWLSRAFDMTVQKFRDKFK